MKEIVRLPLKENVEETHAKEENVNDFREKILFTFISILEVNMGLINSYSVVIGYFRVLKNPVISLMIFYIILKNPYNKLSFTFETFVKDYSFHFFHSARL